RGDLQHVPTCIAGAPDADSAAVDLETGLAVAIAEIAVVVDEDGEAILDEALGVFVEEHLLGAGEAVSHNDRGNGLLRAVGHVEPSTKSEAFGIEFDIAS